MAYTEIKERNKTKYFYRVKSKRIGTSFKKERIYLGKNLTGINRILEIDKADKKLNKEKIKSNIKKIKPIIRKILKKYKITKAGIFGSYSIGENKKNSDIDILIKPAKGMGLELVELQTELSNTLNKKVDIVSYKYIHPRLKKRVLSQEVKIL
ncbi:hypothetical protein HNV12_02160 [Methanococcoides sp. SA1]|nr:hypothetical protein [Methanococcoides sp. SA1]